MRQLPHRVVTLRKVTTARTTHSLTTRHTLPRYKQGATVDAVSCLTIVSRLLLMLTVYTVDDDGTETCTVAI
jgi:hypothetical protein